MKIYKVKVNGKSYVVELESVNEVKSDAPVSVASAPKAADAPAPVAGEGQDVLSPIQGNVVDVKVKVGQRVAKGDVLMIVEAMKLENEIVSPFDGVVSTILANKGSAVQSKQVLVKIK
ncbi:MAG: biotin/lipoyl-binding protein [Bacilli bacterium]|nr:biotin/lipoyl-binding protein [Bacilli bacterium]